MIECWFQWDTWRTEKRRKTRSYKYRKEVISCVSFVGWLVDEKLVLSKTNSKSRKCTWLRSMNFFYGEKRTRNDKNKLNRMIWWECIVTSDRSVFRFLLCIMRASVYYYSVNGKINIKQIKWRSSKKTRRQTQAILERKRVYVCVLVCGCKMSQWKQ